MSADWLNGIGLVCNMLGALGIFVFGVPRYPTRERAGKSFLLLEGPDDEDERTRVTRADWLNKAGAVLLGIGFALQFAALFVD